MGAKKGSKKGNDTEKVKAEKTKKVKTVKDKDLNKKESKEKTQGNKEESTEYTSEEENYVQELEKKLEKTLSKIEGAGRVEVMITLEDSGESIVEKDTVTEASDLQEADNAGGNRIERSTQTGSETVYKEQDSEKTPFVGKEMTTSSLSIS